MQSKLCFLVLFLISSSTFCFAACDVGKWYNANDGECKECAKGYATTITTSTSNSDCTACAAGYAYDAATFSANTAGCTECASGTYKEVIGNTPCSKCDPNAVLCGWNSAGSGGTKDVADAGLAVGAIVGIAIGAVVLAGGVGYVVYSRKQPVSVHVTVQMTPPTDGP